jgi:hypothetical protein
MSKMVLDLADGDLPMTLYQLKVLNLTDHETSFQVSFGSIYMHTAIASLQLLDVFVLIKS